MHYHRLSIVQVACILHVSAAGQSQRDLPQVVQTISADEYHQVLDRLFPAPSQIRDRDVIFTLSLRTTPAFDAESQIDIVLRREQNSTAQYSHVDGNVYSTCNKLLQTTGVHQPEILAQKIALTRKLLNVSPNQILRWQQDLFAGLASSVSPLPRTARRFLATGMTTVTMDGASYRLRYVQGETDLDIRFTEPDLGKGLTLIKWARNLQQEIAKLPEAK